MDLEKIFRKGQSSAEFVILLGFMILVLLVFFIIVQEKIVEANEEKNQMASQEIMDILVSEIRLAESVSDKYYREFYLPLDLNGLDYDIDIIMGVASTSEIVLKYEEKERVYFLEEFVDDTSSVGIGLNNITKNGNRIMIKKMS